MVVEFRVPQQTVPARLLLEDGAMLEGRLFAPSVGPESVAQRVLDRLNDAAERFVPLSRGDDQLLVQKAWIVWVQLTGDAADSPDEEAALTHRLRLTFTRGKTLAGQVSYVMRPERSRVLDFLNATPRFFQIRDDSRTTLVNSDFIQQAHDLSGALPGS